MSTKRKRRSKAAGSPPKKKRKTADQIDHTSSATSSAASSDATKQDSSNSKEEEEEKNGEDLLPEAEDIVLHEDCFSTMLSMDDGHVDLVLTDPPYIISRKSLLDENYAASRSEQPKQHRTEEQYNAKAQKTAQHVTEDQARDNYLRTGSIYGKDFQRRTHFGDWDVEFDLSVLERFVSESYRILKDKGTIIVFCDVWKIESLKRILLKHKFKSIRLIEWVKSNPFPRNARLFYLDSPREVALCAVKGSSPTFHSYMDNGIYRAGSDRKGRFHPTQKPLKLFTELVEKHSNEGDLIFDGFAGSATTAVAALRCGRRVVCCEREEDFVKQARARLVTEGLVRISE